MKILLTLAIILVWLCSAQAQTNDRPVDYQAAAMQARSSYPHETYWSARIAREWDAEAEYRLPNDSRVDILTDDTAYEVEWPEKWKEAIGQSGLYSLATNRKPGIVLLMGRGDRAKEKYYYTLCLSVCAKWDITLKTYKVTPNPQRTTTRQPPTQSSPSDIPQTPAEELEAWHREHDPIIPAGD